MGFVEKAGEEPKAVCPEVIVFDHIHGARAPPRPTRTHPVKALHDTAIDFVSDAIKRHPFTLLQQYVKGPPQIVRQPA
jgi:hypothetical protein